MKKIYRDLFVPFVSMLFVFSGSWTQAETLEADVVIVGGGTAGMAAAVAAAEGGAKVLVLEKTKITGGSGNLAGGIFGVESRVQNAQGIQLTKEEVFNDLMAHSQWKANARLMKAFVETSGSTMALKSRDL